MQLANSSHEAFAIHVAAGDSYRKAAIKVGFAASSAGNSGTRLMRMGSVAQRVAELRSTIPDTPVTAGNPGMPGDDPKIAGSRPWVTSKLIEIVQIGLATARPDPLKPDKAYAVDLSNANRALEILAKLGGFITTESRTVKEVHSFDHTSAPGHIVDMLKQRFGDLTPGERKQLANAGPDVIDILLEAEEL